MFNNEKKGYEYIIGVIITPPYFARTTHLHKLNLLKTDIFAKIWNVTNVIRSSGA